MTVKHDAIRDCCKFLEFTLPSKHSVNMYDKFIMQHMKIVAIYTGIFVST